MPDIVIGIVSTLPADEVVRLVNQFAHIRLTPSSPARKDSELSSPVGFPVYSFICPATYAVVRFIGNKATTATLVECLTTIDYFLWFSKTPANIDMESLCHKLRDSRDVHSVLRFGSELLAHCVFS